MMQTLPTVLITGGAGFIGSALVRQWLQHESSSIVNLDNFTYAGLPASLEEVLVSRRHRLVTGDIANGVLVDQILTDHRPHAIIHLAAESHVDRSIDKPSRFTETNVLGTCVLLDSVVRYWQTLTAESHEAFRFLLVSTDEVFGSTDQNQPFTRASPLAPNSPYAATKAAGELMARAYQKTYGLPLLVVNPTNNYGPRQLPEKLIPKMILLAAAGEPLPLYGDGLHQRDWLHVEDCCRALRQILRQGDPGNRYLVGTGQCRTNLQVLETICDLVDEWLKAEQGMTLEIGSHPGTPRTSSRRLIQHVPDRPGHDRLYAVDSHPLRKELGWQPQVSFETGLRDTVRWYLENTSWTEQAWDSLRAANC